MPTVILKTRGVKETFSTLITDFMHSSFHSHEIGTFALGFCSCLTELVIEGKQSYQILFTESKNIGSSRIYRSLKIAKYIQLICGQEFYS